MVQLNHSRNVYEEKISWIEVLQACGTAQRRMSDQGELYTMQCLVNWVAP
jgi:hypothetical protein